MNEKKGIIDNKCKLCGGPLNLAAQHDGRCRCEYCGAVNEIGDDTERQREDVERWLKAAVKYRDSYEFNSALELYEEILKISPDNYDAIWGRLCCRYGVVYVEDENGNGALTCHKLVDTNIFEDKDYLMLKTGHWLGKYRRLISDVERFSQIQAEIKKLRNNGEKKYDVFICYKQRELDGRGVTVDSFDAEMLYYTLKREGYNVFFSKKTLRNRAGVLYEAAIFDAISSAKIMIVLGSRPEYFRSTWVKSEWQRFLAYMKGDLTEKLLVPMYKGMSIQDLPRKLTDYQAINFELDERNHFSELMRNIRSVINKDTHTSRDEKVKSAEIDENIQNAINMLAETSMDIRQLDCKNEPGIMKLIETDTAFSSYLLGCIYYVQGNNLEAKRYFQRSADKGSEEARKQIAFMRDNRII